MMIPRKLLITISSCALVAGGAATVTAPASADDGYGQQVAWGDCGGFASLGAYEPEDVAGFECGYVTVPVDYANPDGASADIAVIRKPATGPRIGSLLLNPGGPGGSGVDLAVGLADDLAQLNDTFDLVGFDPRGVSNSVPALDCYSSAERDALRAQPYITPTPEGITLIEAQSAEVGERCAAAVGEDFLANIGTKTVAKDLDVIRDAVGDEQLTYLGYSYGTSIGAEYAAQFPDRVRAMILDGAVDPNADRNQQIVNQYAGFQVAFDDFAAECAQSADCALGTDPSAAVARLHELVLPLIDNPLPLPDGRILTYSDAMTGIILSMYSATFWTPLEVGLAGLLPATDPRSIGGDSEYMMLLADVYYERDEAGNYPKGQEVQTAVNCVDRPYGTNREEANYLDSEVRRVAPFYDDGRGTGLGALSSCAFWPVPPTGLSTTVDHAVLPQIVVVSTTHDPATPYQAGVDLAAQLQASLVTVEDTGHGSSFNGTACVDDELEQYLEELDSPPAGLTCAA